MDRKINYLEVDIVKYTHNDFPGWVLCKFVDFNGETHHVEEKVPIVSDKKIDENTLLPQKGYIRGTIINNENGTIYFSTLKPDGIETKSKENTFYINEKQIFEFDEQLFQRIKETIENNENKYRKILIEYKNNGGKQKSAYFTLSKLYELYDKKNMETEYNLVLDILDFVVGYCHKEHDIWEEYLET